MASYLRSLNLVNGVEEVNTGIEIQNSGIDLYISGSNSVNDTLYVGTIDSTSIPTIALYREDSLKFVEIQFSNNSTQNLDLHIKNTKAVLDSGDILAYNGTEFELQNISDVIVKNNKSFKNVFLLGGM
jgi:hypothetical protein